MTSPRLRIAHSGFTLLEIILVFGLLLIFTSISVPIYYSYQANSDLDTASQQLVQALHRARHLARSGDKASTWGVHVDGPTGITLFKGTSFSARDQAEDEQFALVSSIQVSSTLSPTGEVVFAQVIGSPSSVGEIVLLQLQSGRKKTIVINQWNITVQK